LKDADTCDDESRKAARLLTALDTRPKLPLGHFPTPLSRLRSIKQHLGRDHLYLKRDDLTGVSLGGNKVRGLEYLLGEALSRRADVVITGGGLQSNLCSLTAAACAKAGLRCVLVHNDVRPEAGAIAGNMLLNKVFGAEEIFLGRVPEEERAAAMKKVAADLRAQGSVPYVIHNGASTPVGALGYVAAALELLVQSEAMELHLKHVTIVGAMGGTAAGLVFGAAALGAPFHVHVISVEYPEEELRQRIADLTADIENVLGLRPPVSPDEVMTITTGTSEKDMESRHGSHGKPRASSPSGKASSWRTYIHQRPSQGFWTWFPAVRVVLAIPAVPRCQRSGWTRRVLPHGRHGRAFRPNLCLASQGLRCVGEPRSNTYLLSVSSLRTLTFCH
jgi:1-aminocyclopropane-1-carboxylate deaminase/D-cysteine desulfhydrase-like pyridoxal-dependent ACC family enzyme